MIRINSLKCANTNSDPRSPFKIATCRGKQNVYTLAETHENMYIRTAKHTYTKYLLCLRVSASGLADQQEATSSAVSSLPQLQ